jgi:hypothetical protein
VVFGWPLAGAVGVAVKTLGVSETTRVWFGAGVAVKTLGVFETPRVWMGVGVPVKTLRVCA